mgnify:FL=1
MVVYFIIKQDYLGRFENFLRENNIASGTTLPRITEAFQQSGNLFEKLLDYGCNNRVYHYNEAFIKNYIDELEEDVNAEDEAAMELQIRKILKVKKQIYGEYLAKMNQPHGSLIITNLETIIKDSILFVILIIPTLHEKFKRKMDTPITKFVVEIRGRYT